MLQQFNIQKANESGQVSKGYQPVLVVSSQPHTHTKGYGMIRDTEGQTNSQGRQRM